MNKHQSNFLVLCAFVKGEMVEWKPKLGNKVGKRLFRESKHFYLSIISPRGEGCVCDYLIHFMYLRNGSRFFFQTTSSWVFGFLSDFGFACLGVFWFTIY